MLEEIFPGLGTLTMDPVGSCTCQCWCPIAIERTHDMAELQTDIFVDEM